MVLDCCWIGNGDLFLGSSLSVLAGSGVGEGGRPGSLGRFSSLLVSWFIHISFTFDH